jgi:hypothetical protein
LKTKKIMIKGGAFGAGQQKAPGAVEYPKSLREGKTLWERVGYPII